MEAPYCCGQPMRSLDLHETLIRARYRSYVCDVLHDKVPCGKHVAVAIPAIAVTERACGICKLTHSECTCFRRGGKVIDDFHLAYAVAHFYITTETFFGKEKHEIALAMVQSARLDFLSQHYTDTYTECVGFERMKLDKDASRLKSMADGRLFATRQKMREREEQTGNAKESRQSSAETIRRWKESRGLPLATP